MIFNRVDMKIVVNKAKKYYGFVRGPRNDDIKIVDIRESLEFR